MSNKLAWCSTCQEESRAGKVSKTREGVCYRLSICLNKGCKSRVIVLGIPDPAVWTCRDCGKDVAEKEVSGWFGTCGDCQAEHGERVDVAIDMQKEARRG